MSWICWAAIFVFAFNVVFFGVLAAISLTEDRRDKHGSNR